MSLRAPRDLRIATAGLTCPLSFFLPFHSAFLIPTEIFPTEMRAMGNGYGITGWSLGCGSAALANPRIFSSLGNRAYFLFTALDLLWIPFVYCEFVAVLSWLLSQLIADTVTPYHRPLPRDQRTLARVHRRTVLSQITIRMGRRTGVPRETARAQGKRPGCGCRVPAIYRARPQQEGGFRGRRRDPKRSFRVCIAEQSVPGDLLSPCALRLPLRSVRTRSLDMFDCNQARNVYIIIELLPACSLALITQLLAAPDGVYFVFTDASCLPVNLACSRCSLPSCD